MKKIFTLVVIGFLFLSSPVFAENATSTPSQADTIKQLQEQIKMLEAQIAQMAAELSATKKEIATIKEDLRITKTLKLGMADEEVKKLQEFLSTMPDVYPEGLVTGYFGSLTERAVKKLQEKNGIESVGIVGPKTRSKLSELSGGSTFTGDSAPATVGIPFSTTVVELKATTTPLGLENRAATTPSGTVPATPAVPSSGSGTTPATPAVPAQTQDTTAPVISNISATTTQTTATITWTTNELADSRVIISTSTPLVAEDLTMTTSHNLSFSNLSSGTVYYYTVISKDVSGNATTSSVNSFSTLQVVVINPYTTLNYPGTTGTTQAYGVSGNYIVGTYEIYGSNDVHGFVYDGTTWKTIDKPGVNYTSPWGISGNNITGFYMDGSGNTHGFLYDGTTWTTLDMPGASATYINGISGNNIVGYRHHIPGDGNRGFLYNGTTWTALDMPGANYTTPMGISGNNVVGSYISSSGPGLPHGFVYDGTTWKTIDRPGAAWTGVYGISGNSVVGCYQDAPANYGKIHGFIYDGASWTILDVPEAGIITCAMSISGNNIVGYYNNPSGDHGFQYTINH